MGAVRTPWGCAGCKAWHCTAITLAWVTTAVRRDWTRAARTVRFTRAATAAPLKALTLLLASTTGAVAGRPICGHRSTLRSAGRVIDGLMMRYDRARRTERTALAF